MIVLVGGLSRHAGKTSVVAAVIRALPEAHWLAVKITPHAHAAADVFEETDPRGSSDTSRYLAAGAARALLVRAQAASAAEVLLRLAENAIVESNSALNWLRPDLCVMVADPAIAEVKESALAFLARAETVLRVERGKESELIELVRARLTPPETQSPRR